MTEDTRGQVRQVETRAAALREAFAEGRLLRVAGAHDGLSARLVAEAGFDAVWASGLEISAAHGLPDISLLGMAEFLAAAATMQSATAVPVVADCDTGFGGDRNAAFTMMRYENVGIAAVCIEDKVFPKLNSFLGAGQELLATEDFGAKLRAAKQAQHDPDTVLIARTEAFICGYGVEEALARCHHYVDVGADAVLVHSKAADSSEVVSFTRRWQRRAPVVVVPTTYTAFSVAEAQEAGVAMVIYANQGMRATVRAVRDAWAAVLADGSTVGIESTIASVKDIFELSGMSQWLGRG
ncbi:isocitrate lyase/phosphoenolpyruvate mutase family protein [Actinokineospora auranticolor]|uniref:Phosphoenolpyruvate phosphomutase n=1 Tax=Actinokineospora auranticolor TaxID=155976 RepID=A0A2S6GPT2_9PSEU|nr:isocitrate lyase/phosphoenolpyruvate mutase family protein [Actinokineospora auranticolor]PPK67173.1 phosphoenolpyruvate phosphomutase [Actinokineospora auranticolor]